MQSEPACYTGYALNKLKKEIEQLKNEKNNPDDKCQKGNLPAEELEGYLYQVNEIDKEILRKLKEATEQKMIGIYVGGPALAVFCAVSPFLPF